MTVSLIVAYDCDTRAIGKDNKLLFEIPDDLKRFKKLTSNNTVIMGRETLLSIGKPLPNRLNIILSRNKEYLKELEQQYSPSVLLTANSIQEAIDKAKKEDKEIFIIGGASVYKQAILDNIVDKFYLTVILGRPYVSCELDYSDISEIETPIEQMSEIVPFDKNISAEYYLPEFHLSIKKRNNVSYSNTIDDADSFFEPLNLENYELEFLENKYHNGLHYINMNFKKNKAPK